MNRRSFIRSLCITAVGATLAPTMLESVINTPVFVDVLSLHRQKVLDAYGLPPIHVGVLDELVTAMSRSVDQQIINGDEKA